jgi:hypothetical protein
MMQFDQLQAVMHRAVGCQLYMDAWLARAFDALAACLCALNQSVDVRAVPQPVR